MISMFKKKSLFGYKCIRFKSKKQFMSSTVPKTKDVLDVRLSKLAQMLDCTNYTAREIITRNSNILAMNFSEFLRNAKFCGQRLKLSDVVEFPCLLSMNSSLLQHRYLSLKELGCSNISGSTILKYLQLMKKSPKLLKKEGFSFYVEKNIDMYINFLDCEVKEDFEERLLHLHQNNCSLWKLKEVINAEIFASQLDCSIATTHRMFRRYPPLRIQSIENTLKVFDVLRRKYNFSASKICVSPAILSMHHEAADLFLEEVPTVLGVDAAELVLKLPALLKRPVKSLHEIERVLRHFDITGAQLLRCPRVITFSPETLERRLEVLCSRFGGWKKHKRFLWLVCRFNRLKLEADYGATPFSKKSLRDDSLVEVISYLAGVLSVPAEKVQLRKAPVSLSNCSQVVEYLLGCGVDKRQLANGLDVTLYDVEVVRARFEELKERPQFAEWSTHYNLLQLLVYTIEAEHGFRGKRFESSE